MVLDLEVEHAARGAGMKTGAERADDQGGAERIGEAGIEGRPGEGAVDAPEDAAARRARIDRRGVQGLLAAGTGNSVMTPPVVILLILSAVGLVWDSVNQRVPSGSARDPRRPAIGGGNGELG